MNKLILASSSPRRKELLTLLGYEFEIITKNVPEIVDYALPKEEIVMSLAKQKANPVFLEHSDDIVLGFDTLVYIDNEILGKPKDKNDLSHMMHLLSGRTHEVITGGFIKTKDGEDSFFSRAYVKFNDITEDEIKAYVELTEPYDKAGGYAIQGYASRFIENIEGDFFSIMGLPVNIVYKKLQNILKK